MNIGISQDVTIHRGSVANECSTPEYRKSKIEKSPPLGEEYIAKVMIKRSKSEFQLLELTVTLGKVKICFSSDED